MDTKDLRYLIKQKFNYQFDANGYYRLNKLINRYGTEAIEYALTQIYKTDLESPLGYLEVVIRSLINKGLAPYHSRTESRIKKLVKSKKVDI